MLLRRYHPAPDTGEDEPPRAPSSGDDGPDLTKRPARSASKAEWLAYAVAQGADEAEADDATKEQLIEQYGG